jgi:hypothetical protein
MEPQSRGRREAGGWSRGASVCLSLLLGLVASPGAAAVRWLPGATPAPTLVADPYEPRVAVAVFPSDEHIATSVGGLFPLAGSSGDLPRVAASLEGEALLDLGIDGNLFPLETMDGVFGLRVDAAQDIARVSLRARHLSAHRADGDSTVIYPPGAVSREFVTVEAGLHPGTLYVYARIGAAWHAVPKSSGAMTAVGIQWSRAEGAWRPMAAVHWENDPARGAWPTWSLFAGVETGGMPFRLGLRWFQGPGPGGQHPERHAERLGFELQLAPLGR